MMRRGGRLLYSLVIRGPKPSARASCNAEYKNQTTSIPHNHADKHLGHSRPCAVPVVPVVPHVHRPMPPLSCPVGHHQHNPMTPVSSGALPLFGVHWQLFTQNRLSSCVPGESRACPDPSQHDAAGSQFTVHNTVLYSIHLVLISIKPFPLLCD